MNTQHFCASNGIFCMSVCLSICLYIYPSACLSVCLLIFLLVCLMPSRQTEIFFCPPFFKSNILENIVLKLFFITYHIFSLIGKFGRKEDLSPTGNRSPHNNSVRMSLIDTRSFRLTNLPGSSHLPGRSDARESSSQERTSSDELHLSH